MTQSDKDLLLRDLCARLPYGVMVSVKGGEFNYYKYPYQLTAVSKFGLDSFCKVYHPIYTPLDVPKVEDVKPYLRPISSMTEDEFLEYHSIKYNKVTYRHNYKRINVGKFYNVGIIPIKDYLDWLNVHHFDYLDLIPNGLALEAPESMY